MKNHILAAAVALIALPGLANAAEVFENWNVEKADGRCPHNEASKVALPRDTRVEETDHEVEHDKDKNLRALRTEAALEDQERTKQAEKTARSAYRAREPRIRADA